MPATAPVLGQVSHPINGCPGKRELEQSLLDGTFMNRKAIMITVTELFNDGQNTIGKPTTLLGFVGGIARLRNTRVGKETEPCFRSDEEFEVEIVVATGSIHGQDMNDRIGLAKLNVRTRKGTIRFYE